MCPEAGTHKDPSLRSSKSPGPYGRLECRPEQDPPQWASMSDLFVLHRRFGTWPARYLGGQTLPGSARDGGEGVRGVARLNAVRKWSRAIPTERNLVGIVSELRRLNR